MDVFSWVLTCSWWSFVLILKPAGCSVECGRSCWCDEDTRKLISCAVYNNSREIRLERAKIQEAADDFKVDFDRNDSFDITVVFGKNLVMNNLRHFARSLKSQNVTVTGLIVRETATLSIDKLNWFYRKFQKDIERLDIDDSKLRPSKEEDAPYHFELSQGSQKVLVKFKISSTNNINMKGDLVFRTGGKKKKIDLEAFSNASFKEIDIYFDESERSETNKIGQVDVFHFARCSYEAYSPTFPRLIQVNSTYENKKDPNYSVELRYENCKEIFLPASFLAYMNTNLELNFSRESLPTKIEWGALGTEKLKVKTFLFFGANTDRLVVTPDIEDLWSKYECTSMPRVEMCVICFMQHFGLHRIKDNLVGNCSLVNLTNTDNTTYPQELIDFMQPKVNKCLRQCPKELNYPDGVMKPNYKDYILCDSGKNLTISCNIELETYVSTSTKIPEKQTIAPTISTKEAMRESTTSSEEQTAAPKTSTTEVIKKSTTSSVGPVPKGAENKSWPFWVKVVAAIILTVFMVVHIRPASFLTQSQNEETHEERTERTYFSTVE